MADVHNKSTRSFNMSRIRSVDTKPEMVVRKFLHASGLRFRLHDKKLPGKPDIVLPKFKTIVLIHGCFWHGHQNCKDFKLPKTRIEYWSNKIANNIRKDLQIQGLLANQKWDVITIWACQLEGSQKEGTLANLLNQLTQKQAKLF